MLTLATKLSELGWIRSISKDLYKKLEITTVHDLLSHVPTRYLDFTVGTKIDKIQEGEIVSFVAKIDSFRNVFTKYGKNIQEAVISDESGQLDVVWFNQKFLSRVMIPGQTMAFSGKVGIWKKRLALIVPQYEIIPTSPENDYEQIHTGRLVPVYSETKGLTSKAIRTHIHKLLNNPTFFVSEFLPDYFLNQNNLIPESQAYKEVHFPNSLDAAYKARHRLSFDELFLVQLSSELVRRKRQEKQKRKAFQIDKYKNEIDKFILSLPFTLTQGQLLAVSEIKQDFRQPFPMNRILVGDVGSGKTIVSAIAAYITHLNGFKSVIMAPTEILAHQHFQTFEKLFKPLSLSVGLVTAKTKISQKKDVVTIGTHALLSKPNTLEDVGLVMIDEQQRFGVVQRARLSLSQNFPHILTTTATPIPRTIALTLFSELDISTLNEKPQGRIEIKTWVVPPEKRKGAYGWIKDQILDGKKRKELTQAFIICPLINESENLASVKAASTEYDLLKTSIYPDLKIALLHGKMKSEEKTDILSRFKKGEFDILVATPVVEVGIDIPTATIMMIEASDRYGLAQLHQLRGRVGRNNRQSYCLLFTEAIEESALKRLKYMETIHMGPELAEKDLMLRGPGDLFGTKQHGFGGLRIASYSNIELIKEARSAVQTFLKVNSNDNLTKVLQERLKSYTIDESVIE